MKGIPSFIINDQRVIQIKPTNEILYSICEEIWFDLRSKYTFCLLTISFQYIVPVLIVVMTYCRICNFLHFHNYKSNVSFRSTSQVNRAQSIVVIEKENFTRPQCNVKVNNDDNKSIEQTSICDHRKSVVSFANDRKQSSRRKSQVKFNRKTIVKKNIYARDYSRNLRQKRYERSKNLLILVSLTFVICW